MKAKKSRRIDNKTASSRAQNIVRIMTNTHPSSQSYPRDTIVYMIDMQADVHAGVYI